MRWDAGHDFGKRDGWASKKIFDRAANVADKQPSLKVKCYNNNNSNKIILDLGNDAVASNTF